MKYNIFVITIKRNEKRFRLLLEKFKHHNIPFHIVKKFYGIDGKQLSFAEINNIISDNFGKIASLCVIGCAASHILLWKHVSENKNLDYAIILEDDTVLDYQAF